MAKKTPDQQDSDAPKPSGRGRSKPGAAERASNVPDETYVEFCNKAWRAQADMEEAQATVNSLRGIYRGVLKDAKKAGCNQSAITRWLSERKREIGDVDRDIRDFNRVAKLMNLPIGTQLGMFDDGENVTTVATAIEKEILQHPARSAQDTGEPAASVDGYFAGKNGKPRSENPYQATDPSYDAWERSWLKAQQDLAEEMRVTAGGATA